MSKPPILVVLCLALLWPLEPRAAGYLESLEAAPKASLEGLQHKAVPKPNKQELRDHRKAKDARGQRDARPAIPRARPAQSPSSKPVKAPVLGPGTLSRAPGIAPPRAPVIGPGRLPQAPGATPAKVPGLDRGKGPLPAGPGSDALPDLSVADIRIVGGEIRFVVVNSGPGEKKPGEIRYIAEVRYQGRPASARIPGIAAVTSLTRLPANSAGRFKIEDRVASFRAQPAPLVDIRLCLNEDGRVPEESLENNCRRQFVRFPDLEIVSAEFVMQRQEKKKKPGWKRPARWLWDKLTVEFDESGIFKDPIRVRIRNNGAGRASNFQVLARLEKEGRAVGEFSTVYAGVLEPGQTALVAIDVPSKGLWKDERCCGGLAKVDAAGRIQEAEEGNNEAAITTRRVVVPDPRRSRDRLVVDGPARDRSP